MSAGARRGSSSWWLVDPQGDCSWRYPAISEQVVWIRDRCSGRASAEARFASIRDYQSKGTTEGLSLYLVPRTLPSGERNGLSVTRLEGKLGIYGSPTAAIEFVRAEGFLVGTKGDGFKAMLSLMNNARLGMAAQGIGIAEAALSVALRYARQRGHLLALEEPGDESEAFIHRSTRSPRHPGAPQMPVV